LVEEKNKKLRNPIRMRIKSPLIYSATYDTACTAINILTSMNRENVN